MDIHPGIFISALLLVYMIILSFIRTIVESFKHIIDVILETSDMVLPTRKIVLLIDIEYHWITCYCVIH